MRVTAGRVGVPLLLVLLVLLTGGCAKTVYRHPNYTPQRWAQDSYECERDMRQSGYFGTGIYAQMNMQGQVLALLDNRMGDALEVGLTAGAVRSV